MFAACNQRGLTPSHALNSAFAGDNDQKTMKRLSTLSLSLGLITAVCAQPTLTFVGNAPQPGFNFTLNYGPFVSPGAAGTDQTWDLSTLMTDSSVAISMVDPSTTTNGASFPGSTVTETGAVATMYYRSANDGMYFVGSDAEDLLIVNSDQGLYLPFPCTYQTTWTDSLIADFSVEGFDVHRMAEITGEADGYGTLIMPFGTVENVLRIHWYEEAVDDAGMFDVTSTYDSYLYYVEGQPWPMAHVITTSVTILGNTETTQHVQWVEEVTTSVPAIAATPEVSVFPNPATDMIRVHTAVPMNGAVTIAVVDLQGRVVREVRNAWSEQMIVNVAELPAGLYNVVATDANGVRATAKVTVE
jgi:hypothetical protein